MKIVLVCLAAAGLLVLVVGCVGQQIKIRRLAKKDCPYCEGTGSSGSIEHQSLCSCVYNDPRWKGWFAI